MDWGLRQPKTILLVNDDGPPGPHSPFISAFVDMLITQLPEARIIVYLPSEQQSWVSKKVDRFGAVKLIPLSAAPDGYPDSSLTQLSRAMWAIVDGSPATCVLLALLKLSPVKPDLIISGPNIGQNCGSSYVLSSGTVSGALEGALQGIRSVSLSVSYRDLPDDWEPHIPLISTLCRKLGNVVARLWKSWPDGLNGLLYNVNIGLESSIGAQIQLSSVMDESYGLLYARANENESTNGAEYYRFQKCCFSKDPPDGTDRSAINNGFISVTPLLPRYSEPVLSKESVDAIMSSLS